MKDVPLSAVVSLGEWARRGRGATPSTSVKHSRSNLFFRPRTHSSSPEGGLRTPGDGSRVWGPVLGTRTRPSLYSSRKGWCVESQTCRGPLVTNA